MSAAHFNMIRCDCGWIGPVPFDVRCPRCKADLAPWEPRIVDLRTCLDTREQLIDAVKAEEDYIESAMKILDEMGIE